jgi:CTP:phosphocholine cytidylyltransferase-like protein
MLTKKQFDIMVFLVENDYTMSQRDMASALGFSVGSMNKFLTELTDLGYVEQKRLTNKGFNILENYRVKRAVFIAAGFGARLVPITLNTPKPLVRIKGKRIIDTLLDAVTAIGITEIHLVRGYLAEQFDQLLYKYPTINFIENPAYNETNNISSAVCVSGHLNNAYIMDADLYLKNPKLITRYQYSSNYLGVPVKRTDDWCLLVKNGRIDSVSLGGENCHTWIGLSYWTEHDGKRLSNDIKEVYKTPGGKEKYWDMVPLEYYKKNYNVGVRECSFDDIIEIDTFRELKEIDKTYDV